MIVFIGLLLAVGTFAETQDCPNTVTPIYIPDFSNCSLYYECIRGQKYQATCPPGLLFNSDTKYCDLAEFVECGSVDPTCPASGEIEKFVYPDDCSKYYECKDGRKLLKDCPENLYFNPSTLQCDYMDNVDCHAVPSPPTKPSTPNTPASTRASTISTTTPGSVDPTCPASGEIAKMVDPDDCSKYYECKDGRKSLKDCPENLYFNPSTLQCDYMDNVNCQAVPSRPTYPTNPTTASTRASTITTSTPGPIDPSCPASEGITKMVDPDDCSKYYECKDGRKSLKDCPENLYFNSETLQCDYMDNVNCQIKPPVSPTQAPNPTTAKTTTPSPPPVTTAGPADVCQGIPDGTFVGKPDNCRQYYDCIHGKGILFNCPPGTIWNTGISSCTVSDVDC